MNTIETTNASEEQPSAPPQSIIHEYEQREVSSHPLFVYLKNRPVDYGALWLLMANLQISISGHFVRWLASVIERVDDLRIASLIAKQLDDELGNGHFADIHGVLLERFVSALAAQSQVRGMTPADPRLTPGRELLASMNRIFGASDVYEGVGALMVSEIFANKMDRCVGDELRRQSALSRESLKWLDLHETLEAEHAADSCELAVLVPTFGAQLQATWRGARAEWNALWRLLDDVHALLVAPRAGAELA